MNRLVIMIVGLGLVSAMWVLALETEAPPSDNQRPPREERAVSRITPLTEAQQKQVKATQPWPMLCALARQLPNF